jgi:hypothetical protein
MVHNVFASSRIRLRFVMAEVTFQVLEGMERGHVFTDLETPFTIGREEDNAIQLNDERVSRFHLKIQEDAGQVILTDLESTNGTRVNGTPAQLRALQVGDLVSIGRCLLVYGSPREISERFKDGESSALRRLQEIAAGSQSGSDEENYPQSGATFDPGSAFPSAWSDLLDAAAQGLATTPPPLPNTFQLAQQAQLTDLIAYIHRQLLLVLSCGRELSPLDRSGTRSLDGPVWQQLVDLEMRLAQMIREISNPVGR